VAVICTAVGAGDASPKLKAFATTMSGAQAFSVKYTVQPLGGSPAEFSVALAKPDKARVETPTQLSVADGKTITIYDKNENTYYKKPQTEAELMGLFSDIETAVWKPFFKPEVTSAYVLSKDSGSKTTGGKTLNTIDVRVDAKGEMALKLFTDTSSNLLQQGVITMTAPGQDPQTSVLVVSETGLEASADLFAFKAPDGAKELQQSDLIAGKWLTNFEDAQKAAKQFNKGLIVDFYADW
jgi:outer membrane lipoprotein-sorting protein